MPGALRTRSLVWEKQNHTSVVTTVAPVHPAFPRANGFNGFLRTLPGDRAFLSPSSAETSLRQLDASVEASGPHDFAVRAPHRSSSSACASTASRALRPWRSRNAPHVGTGRL